MIWKESKKFRKMFIVTEYAALMKFWRSTYCLHTMKVVNKISNFYIYTSNAFSNVMQRQATDMQNRD